MENFSIHFLGDKPELLDAVVDMHMATWASAENQMTRDAVHKSFSTGYMGQDIPCAFVAVKDGMPVGFLRLKPPAESGLKDAPDSYPWIGSLQVAPHMQRMGIANALLHRAVSHAQEHGYESVHIWTDKTSIYDGMPGFLPKGTVEKSEGGAAKLFEIDAGSFLASQLTR